MLNRLWIAVVLVLLCALPVFAEEPPDALIRHVIKHRVVHDALCTVEPLNIADVECLVFSDDTAKVLWVILFDERIRTTHVLAIKDKKITTVWVRHDLTT